MPSSQLSGLYVLTDARLSGLDPVETALELLAAGVRIIQLRDKEASSGMLLAAAREIVKRCRLADARLIVNDRVDVALSAGAFGVHLGQEDLPVAYARRVAGPELKIGVSTHTLEQAQEAEAGGADYIGFGPVFPTATKDAGKPRGLERLREVTRTVKIPVAAIGGITVENACSVCGAGASMLAVAAAVLRYGETGQNAKAFLARLEECA